jgi:hypothetical protein
LEEEKRNDVEALMLLWDWRKLSRFPAESEVVGKRPLLISALFMHKIGRESFVDIFDLASHLERGEKK